RTGGAALPAGWGRGWDDRRAVVAGDRVGQLPGGEPAAVVAAEVGQRELGAGRGEVERAAVVDADGADVAGVHILEARGSGRAGADRRGAGAVDPDVRDVHVRDRVEVLHREVADQHDRVVGAVQEAVTDDLDGRVDAPLQRVDPDGAQADVPVQLVRAGADGGVA